MAARLFPTRVIEVTAAPEILARRLAARGREPAAELAARLARNVALPAGVVVNTIRNDGSVAAAVEAFVAALNRAAESMRRS